jgi:hypothetical protein
VEVVPYAAARHDLAALHEIEIGGQGVPRQERFARHVAGAFV